MSGVWTQYKRLKAQVPDCLMLFRYGDFYELFDADAELAAPILEIVLTAREMGRGNRVRMAGIPYHALNSYLPKLLDAGHRVAIVEQTGEVVREQSPSSPDALGDEEEESAFGARPGQEERGRGIMDRQVVRVVTAGTVTDPSLLDERSNNYLAAVVVAGERIGLAHADATTGEFAACQISGPQAERTLQQELERLRPAEVLVPRREARSRFGELPPLPAFCQTTDLDPWRLEEESAREALMRHYDVASLDGFGCEGLPLAVQAAGAIVQYLGETQRGAASTLAELRVYSTDGFMALDAATRRNLELLQTSRGGATRGSLLWVLDQTRTALGGRLLRRWVSQPLVELAPLLARQEMAAQLAADTLLRARVAERLSRVGDLERLIHRVEQRQATPRDLLGLRSSLEAVGSLAALARTARASELDAPSAIAEARGVEVEAAPGRAADGFRLAAGDRSDAVDVLAVLSSLDACPEASDLIGRAIVADAPASLGDGVIAPGFSPELDDLIESSRHAREWIASLEEKERQRTGIRGLKVGYNKVFGYYVEVGNANRDLVPESYVRKQTLVGAERYITPELKEYESLVLNAQERIAELETAIFRRVCQEVVASKRRILRSAEKVARLDALASLAEVAVRNSYVRPKLSDGPTMRIVAGRHPVVELARKDEPFVPNDVHLSGDDAQIVILTGPNMSGKSTYLRQVALITLMAQIGSFVPADEAEIGLADRIFTRIGAQDDLGAGQSTFLLEMLETANLLTQSTPRSLLILDEVGRGTSTYDGLAIAQAVVEHIHNHPRLRARTLFATHYHELTELERVLPRTRNYRVDVREEGESVTFLHRVVPGGADRSYGIHVARLAGVPRAVTRRAEEILKELEEGRPSRKRAPRRRGVEEAWQLSLLLEPHPVIEELKAVDVLSLTPLEAITKLFELQQKCKPGSG